MRTLAFIPARGGSKRIPRKNLATVGGVSLLVRAIAVAGEFVPVVSTEDATIAATALASRQEGRVVIHDRPPQLASDHAQIEDALAHYLTRLDDKPEAIVILQPTSPFRTAAHVREALDLLARTGADSVVGVTVGHEPHFAGRLKPVEYWRFASAFHLQPFRDPLAERPRTQDLRPMGTENGAIYAFTYEHWKRTRNRMGGHMVALPMTRVEGWDIDTPEDLAVANAMVAAGVAR